MVYSSEFLDTLAAGILLRDESGRVVDHNQTALDLLGVDADALATRVPFDESWNPVHEDGTPFSLEDQPAFVTLRSGEVVSNVTIGIDVGDQPRRWLTINTFPVHDGERVRGELCTLLEVSARHAERQIMRLITEVNRLVRRSESEAQFLEQTVHALVTVGGFTLARFAIGHHYEHRVDTIFAAGLTDYLYDGMVSWSDEEEIGRGPAGTALRSGETQVANDLSAHPEFAPWRERAAAFGLASSISLPLTLGDARAVLAIYDRHPFAFDDLTVRGLEEMAREIEFGATHVRSLTQLEAALEGTISALARMTETRDPYTAGHQIGVGHLGVAIAQRLGLDRQLTSLIRISGEVHDIGKISVPAEILTRPGRLSQLEFEMVKRHTVVGAEILRRASLPWPIADVALQHHERLDGSGYPAGLRGDAIILPARVIAVADVVEAMTQHRPYRPGLGVEAALAEVRAGAGTRFDADVVAACVAVFADGFSFDRDAPDDSPLS